MATDYYWVLHKITDRKQLFTQDYCFINMKHLYSTGWSSDWLMGDDYMVKIKNLAWDFGSAWVVSKDQLMKIIDAHPYKFKDLDGSKLNGNYYAISVSISEDID